MKTNPLNSTPRKTLSFPDPAAPPEALIDYRDSYFNMLSLFRCTKLRDCARDIHYTLGDQWIELDQEILINGSRGYVLRPKAVSDDDMPRPVTNMIAPTVEVELASLGKRELVPKVITASKDPKIIAATKVAQEVLEYRMQACDWNSIRELVSYMTVVTGTGIIKSYWDESYMDLSLVASTEAVGCDSCGQVLTSPVVGKEEMDSGKVMNANMAQEIPPEQPGDGEKLNLGACPYCPVPSPLAPRELTPEEAEGTDYFNRPLGSLIPKGNTAMEVVSILDLFPENSGVQTDPQSCKIWGQATVRSLDYIEERWPHLSGQIQAENPQELMEIHPILGSWTYLGCYDQVSDSGIYDNHAIVYEVYQDKTLRYPMGRALIVIGDQIAFNGELYVQAPDGSLVARVKYSAARYKTRPGEYYGQSLVDDLISPQNRLNGIDSQLIDARTRMGNPHLAVTEAMELVGPEMREGYGGGKVFRYLTDPLNPQAQPLPIGGNLMPTDVYQERDRIIQDMKAIAGPQDVELGEAPRNISTTSGLQILGEQAEKRRASRERQLIEMYQKTWEHQLQLIWALRDEEDTYEIVSESGEWEVRQFSNVTLEGQTKVKVEKTAFIDKSLYISEAVREALADGLYRPDNQGSIKKILEYRNLPTDVNADSNYQVDGAARQWTDFKEAMVIPVIDESMDDFLIRWQQLQGFVISPEGMMVAEKSGWPLILKTLAGWQEEYDHAEMLDQEVMQFYGRRFQNGDPQAQQMYMAGEQNYQVQLQAYDEQNKANESLAAAAQGGSMMPPVAPPPQPPPPPVLLPAAIDDRILVVWNQKLQMAGLMGQPPQVNEMDGSVIPGMPPPIQLDQNYMKFRAVVDAYQILSKKKMMQDMAMMSMSPDAAGGEGGGGNDINLPGPENPSTPPSPNEVPGGKSNLKGPRGKQ